MNALDLRISKSAARELQQRNEPLLVVAELHFSCLIRKHLYFAEQVSADAHLLYDDDDKLRIMFLPVMGTNCAVSDGPALSRFPLHKPEAFTPKWIAIN